MFKILNIQSFSHVSQRPVGGIEKHVRTFVTYKKIDYYFSTTNLQLGVANLTNSTRKEN